MIFVNSMSDLFHEDVPIDYIGAVFDVMDEASQHTFQVLTKRHERLAELAPLLAVAAERLDGRVDREPPLGAARRPPARGAGRRPLHLAPSRCSGRLTGLDLDGIDWLIAGGESGTGPPAGARPSGSATSATSATRQASRSSSSSGAARAKAGGRLLDGREWNEMPGVAYARNEKEQRSEGCQTTGHPR